MSETKRRDGADVAKIGFRDQALITLLLSLRESDWLTVSPEPDVSTVEATAGQQTDGEESSEKIDVRWVLKTGSSRHDQVKSYTNPVSKKPLNDWARELKKQSSADQNRVVLVGPLGTEAVGVTQLDGAVLLHLGDRMAAIRTEALLHLSGMYREIDHEVLDEALERLITTIDTQSIGGVSWTRPQFMDLLDRTVSKTFQERLHTEHLLAISIHRTVVAHRNEVVHEVVRYTVRNDDTSAQRIHFTVKWDDSTSTKLLHGCASHPDHDGADWDRTGTSYPFKITVSTATPIAPGASVWWGFVVERTGAMEVNGSRRRYVESFLPTTSSHRAQFTLIADGWEAWTELRDGAACVESVAKWVLTTSSEVTRFHTDWRVNLLAPPLEQSAASVKALGEACEEIGLEEIPSVLLRGF